MAVNPQFQPLPAPQPIATLSKSVWELYDRIEPVAIIYGSGRRRFLNEFNSSRRLLRQLWKLGRARVTVRGAICTLGALDPLHLAALNCYLQHCFARQSLNALRAGQLHRFTWYKMQETIPLAWHR